MMQGPVRRHLERKALYTCSSSDSAGLVRVCSAFFRVRFERVQLNVGRILRPLTPGRHAIAFLTRVFAFRQWH